MSENQTAFAPGQAPLLTPRILLPFLLVTLIWGSTWLVIRDQVSSIPPSWSVTWRFIIATIGMFALAWVRKLPLGLDRRGQMLAVMIGIPQFALNFNFVYRAELFITSGLVAVLFALLILPNAVFSRLFLKRPIGMAFIIGTVIAIGGVALLIAHEYRVAPVGGEAVLLGTVLTVAGILSASVANVLQASERMRDYPIITVLGWSMLWGSLANFALALVLNGPPVFEWRMGYAAGLFYLGIVGTVVTFPLYSALIRDIGPGRAAYTSVLIPVVAMMLSTLFEGYRWSLLAVAGGVLVMIGLVVAMQARKPAR